MSRPAAMKLYLSPGTNPSGAIDIYPIISAWSESTLNASSPPALASTAFATGISVGKSQFVPGCGCHPTGEGVAERFRERWH